MDWGISKEEKNDARNCKTNKQGRKDCLPSHVSNQRKEAESGRLWFFMRNMTIKKIGKA